MPRCMCRMHVAKREGRERVEMGRIVVESLRQQYGVRYLRQIKKESK